EVWMQILLMYYSRTGRTKKLAEEIARGIDEVDGIDYNLKSASEVTKEDFLNSQGIIAGSPVYFGTMAAELKDVFDRCISTRKQMENKVGAAFATSNHPTGGKETTLMSIIQALLIYGMIVVGDPMDASGHYGVAFSGPLDERTQDEARKLGRRVADIVKKLGGK
ncbi:MAG: NAD(P)H-dependent oxidoreductase, partial [bacterium]